MIKSRDMKDSRTVSDVLDTDESLEKRSCSDDKHIDQALHGCKTLERAWYDMKNIVIGAGEKAREVENEKNANIKEAKSDIKSTKEGRKQPFLVFMFFLFSNSSVPAMSQVGQAQTKRKRVFWLLVLVGSFMGCCYQVHDFLTVYFQYPVMTDVVMMEDLGRPPFPAVTICNLNRMKKEHYDKRYKYLEKKEWKECEEYLTKCRSRSGPKSGGKSKGPYIPEIKRITTTANYESTFSQRKYQLEFLEFLDEYAKTEPKWKKCYGYKVEEMVKCCSFNSRVCTHENFTYFPSTQFGNCYTFKNTSPKQNDQRNLQGLELDLSVDVGSYMDLTQAAGIRVVIHDPNEDPDPSEDGINISPGYETHLAMAVSTVRRLPYPYRDHCKNYNRTSVHVEQRSMPDCIRMCQQKTNFAVCGCADPLLVSETSAMTPCDLKNNSQTTCLDNVLRNMSENGMPCVCFLPCVSTTYNLQISSSALVKNNTCHDNSFGLTHDPECEVRLSSSNFKDPFSIFGHSNPCDNFLVSFSWRISRFCLNSSSNSSKTNFHRKTLRDKPFKTYSKLKVFFSTKEHYIYTQMPMFNDFELLAHLGGNLGLWLGLSVVAAFQCVEGFFLFFIHCFQRFKATALIFKFSRV